MLQRNYAKLRNVTVASLLVRISYTMARDCKKGYGMDCRDNVRGKNASATIYRIALAATVYYIWQEKNMVVFQNKRRQADAIIRVIIQEIFVRGSMNKMLERRLHSLKYYPSWNVAECIPGTMSLCSAHLGLSRVLFFFSFP